MRGTHAEARHGARARRRAAAGWAGRAATLIVLALLYGCGARERTAPPRDDRVEVALLSPAAGDTVAGEVRLSAALRGRGAVRAVVFLLDEQPLDTLRSPPWETIWSSDAPPGGASRRIRCEGRFGGGDSSGDGSRCIRSVEVGVWVLPDAPPAVRLEIPRGAIWIERLPGAGLRAAAEDPEEGPVPDAMIRWFGGGLRHEVRGSILPLEILPEAEQSVTAEAADRWGRRGACSATVRPFRYRPAIRPTDCVENAAAALRARDPDGLLRRMDAGFRFLPCGEEAAAGWEAVWDTALFGRRLRAWLSEAIVGPLRLAWRPGRPSVWAAGADSLAWISLAPIELGFSRARPPAAHEEQTSGAAAELLLRKEQGADWRILQWRDFQGEVGPSLASLLAEADGLPAAPRSRRCRPSR